jgi:hypothetical protein
MTLKKGKVKKTMPRYSRIASVTRESSKLHISDMPTIDRRPTISTIKLKTMDE